MCSLFLISAVCGTVGTHYRNSCWVRNACNYIILQKWSCRKVYQIMIVKHLFSKEFHQIVVYIATYCFQQGINTDLFKKNSFGTKFFEKMNFFLIFVVLLFNLVNSKHLDKSSSKYKILIRKVLRYCLLINIHLINFEHIDFKIQDPCHPFRCLVIGQQLEILWLKLTLLMAHQIS